MFDHLDCGDGSNYLVDGSCSRRWRQEKPCRTSRNLLAGTCTRSCTIYGHFPKKGKTHGALSLSTRRDTLISYGSDSCCACSSYCRAGPRSLSRATLGGISERILTIFFVSTHEDQWFCAKRYLILGSITSWMGSFRCPRGQLLVSGTRSSCSF